MRQGEKRGTGITGSSGFRRTCQLWMVLVCLAMMGTVSTAWSAVPILPADPESKEKPKKPAEDSVGDDIFAEQIRAVQRREFLKRGRVGIAVGGLYNINDPLQHHVGVGGTVRYHLTERQAFAARFFTYRNIDADTRKQLNNDLHLFPERTDIRFETQVLYSFSPIDGKFSYFGTGISYFDVFINVGGGLSQGFSDDLRPSAIIGIGSRFYLSEWLALEIALNDSIHVASFPSGTTLLHNITTGLALSVHIPFSPRFRSNR